MYKLVITDYNYKDLDPERAVLKDTPIQIYDCNGMCQTEEDVIDVARDADAIITQFVPITKRIIENLEKCKVIVRYAIGLDTIDLESATKHNIMVANVPDYCVNEVADHAIALILSLLRKIKIMDRHTSLGNWIIYDQVVPIKRLSQLSLGLMAFGKIARNLAQKAMNIGFEKVLVFDPYFEDQHEYPDCQFVSFEELLKKSDIISIHAPATCETRHVFNKETLSLMKEGAYLVNTSRGSLVNEQDLVNALQGGHLAGAALDVLEDEKVDADNPLLKLENVIMTPHMAWYSDESIEELKRKVAEQVKQALLVGRPKYWVNKF